MMHEIYLSEDDDFFSVSDDENELFKLNKSRINKLKKYSRELRHYFQYDNCKNKFPKLFESVINEYMNEKTIQFLENLDESLFNFRVKCNYINYNSGEFNKFFKMVKGLFVEPKYLFTEDIYENKCKQCKKLKEIEFLENCMKCTIGYSKEDTCIYCDKPNFYNHKCVEHCFKNKIEDNVWKDLSNKFELYFLMMFMKSPNSNDLKINQTYKKRLLKFLLPDILMYYEHKDYKYNKVISIKNFHDTVVKSNRLKDVISKK